MWNWNKGVGLVKKRQKKKSKLLSFLSELFRTKPLSGLGLVILIVLVLVAIFADQLAPSPMVDGQIPVDVLNKLAPMSLEHPLGTDTLGRDLLSYLIYGARTSVILCVACTILSTILSIFIGVTSAVLGGTYDMVVQRFVDAWQCIPAMLILLILMVLMGNGTIQLILAISIPAGIAGSRLVRSAAMSVKDSGYVKMSNMLGSNAPWKMWHHVLPNILPIIIINMAGSLGGVVMQEASLNFLGYGVDPGTPSWGYLITQQGRMYLFKYPMLALAPGILIALMVFASAMFGDGVRDILDPRLKGGVGSYSSKKLKKITELYKAKTAR